MEYSSKLKEIKTQTRTFVLEKKGQLQTLCMPPTRKLRYVLTISLIKT